MGSVRKGINQALTAPEPKEGKSISKLIQSIGWVLGHFGIRLHSPHDRRSKFFNKHILAMKIELKLPESWET
jgi:hypothetical protein